MLNKNHFRKKLFKKIKNANDQNFFNFVGWLRQRGGLDKGLYGIINQVHIKIGLIIKFKMEKERMSDTFYKNKMMLCKVPDHIYSMCKQMQEAQSELTIGQVVLKSNGELEMEFNEE